jgi:uncharacterized protein YhjY with autotransporter beta-barrel domain
VKRRLPVRARLGTGGLLSVLLLIIVGPVYAQSSPSADLSTLCTQLIVTASTNNGIPPAPILSTIPGLTPYQAANAAAIDFICPKLTQPFPPQGPLNLGLTNQQIGDVLGFWTPDQATENSRAAIETGARQARTIAGRLSALRLGTRGLTVSGLVPGESQTVSWSQLLDPEGIGGGGASADSGPLSRLGAFVNGTYAWGDKDPTSREIGFDFDITGAIAGVDYRITPDLVAGIAFDYAHSFASFQSNLGNTETNSYGGLLYGTYYINSFYIDAYAGFTWNTYSTSRRIVYGPGPTASVPPPPAVNRTAKADPDGHQYSFGAGAGYDIPLGSWTLTPLVRTEFIGLQVDGYTERGADGLNLKVGEQNVTSFVSALGGQVSYAISLPFGVLVPQARAEWRHEYLNNSRLIHARYVADPSGLVFAFPTDDPDRNYASLNVGASAVLKGGWQAFVNYEAILSLKNITYNQFTAGFRIEF